MEARFSDIWKENEKRRREMFLDYDPTLGIGSPIERFKLTLVEGSSLLLPVEMLENDIIKQASQYPTVAEFLHSIDLDGQLQNFLHELSKIRINYDFEYWCATCGKVQDKESKKDVPFILRRPQRKLFAKIWEMWRNDVPVRIVIVKARQWGGSTLVQIFFAWVQVVQQENWHSVIIGDVEGQARNVRGMYSRLAACYPSDLGSITFAPFEGSAKNKIIKERGAVVSIGSMQKPDNLRSFDIMMAHLSEVGLWRETQGKKPEDLAQSVAGTIPAIPKSVIVWESTAKGVGNYFHRLYQNAASGRSGIEPLFIPWFEIELYQLDFADIAEAETFYKSMNPYEKGLWTSGATLEGIKWYRFKKQNEDLDDWRMGSEFPSYVEEAFNSTGKRAFPPAYTKKMRTMCKPPQFVGEVFADSARGVEALSNIRLEPMPKGNLSIWEFPDDIQNISNRYVVSVDIGGVNPEADYSIIRVIDRYWLVEGGVPEAVLTWRGHLDQDLLIWKAVMIAKLYHDAMLAVESNSLDKAADTEGSHFITVLDEIKDFYDNIYARTDPQKIKEGAPVMYGFHTNRATKTDLVNTMRRLYRTNGYIERDARAMDEADYYEAKDNGSYGAVDGEHDDIFMCTAIGLKVSEKMELPQQTDLHSFSAPTNEVLNDFSF